MCMIGGIYMTKKKSAIRLIDPNKFYKLDDKRRSNYIKRVNRYIKNNKTLQQMNNIVSRHVQEYKNDFFLYDFYELLTNNKTKQFLWLIRKSGTDLIPLINDVNADIAYGWYQAIKKENEEYYFIDLESDLVQKISLDKADQIIRNYLLKND